MSGGYFGKPQKRHFFPAAGGVAAEMAGSADVKTEKEKADRPCIF